MGRHLDLIFILAMVNDALSVPLLGPLFLFLLGLSRDGMVGLCGVLSMFILVEENAILSSPFYARFLFSTTGSLISMDLKGF